MSDVMLFGVLKMPYEMAMSSELSRLQFYQRVLQLVARVEAQPKQEPVAWEQFYPDIGKPQLGQEPNNISTEELIYMTGVYDGKVLEREACAKMVEFEREACKAACQAIGEHYALVSNSRAEGAVEECVIAIEARGQS